MTIVDITQYVSITFLILATLSNSFPRSKTGTKYKYGPVAETIYAVTGSSADWTYISLGIKKSFILEVQPAVDRKTSFFDKGFLLPKNQIIPVGKETFAGLKAMWLS